MYKTHTKYTKVHEIFVRFELIKSFLELVKNESNC